MRPIPESLRGRVFTHTEAHESGVSERMLRGKRFVRVLPRVWRCRDHQMTESDWIRAAQLSMPTDARVTGITRLRMLGLDFGSTSPVHLVVARDHHIATEGVFLHRTKKMPTADDEGVIVEYAYIAYCAVARAIDAIKVGDWLLHRGHLSRDRLIACALAEPWRDGAAEARWVSNYLDERSRSLMESEPRAFLVFAGLPGPESNGEILLDDGRIVAGDLVYRDLGLIVEYEGEHHQSDRDQYVLDIARYESIRRSDLDYVQITKEKSRRPRQLVLALYARMVERGYVGPAPAFDTQWELLFLPISVAVADPTVRFSAS